MPDTQLTEDAARNLLAAVETAAQRAEDGPWNRLMLKDEQGKLVNCTDVQVQQEYTVAKNPVLRASRPDDSPEYFRGVGMHGVLRSGTKVIVLSEPVPIDRDFGAQYWVLVKALEPEE